MSHAVKITASTNSRANSHYCSLAEFLKILADAERINDAPRIGKSTAIPELTMHRMAIYGRLVNALIQGELISYVAPTDGQIWYAEISNSVGLFKRADVA